MKPKWLPVYLLLALFLLFTPPPAAHSDPETPPEPEAPAEPEAPVTFAAPAAYQLQGGVVDKSSPTLADVTGDGIPEILVGTTAFNGATNQYDRPTILVVMKGDGSILWSKDVGGPINGSPAVADINRDGQPEIVVSIGGDVADMNQHGGVAAYTKDGTRLWRFNIVDWFPKEGFADGVFSSPTLCDVDSDGDMEIAFGGWDQRIYLLDHQGRSLWNNVPNGYSGQGYMNFDSIWSTAACADLNGDGSKEIIIGADSTGGHVLPDGTRTQDGGLLYVFDRNGTALVRRFLTETIYSSPAVADLNNDGSMEIVVGTGWYWWNVRGQKDASLVHVFSTTQLFKPLHYSDPAKLPHAPGWPQNTPFPGFSSPALGDLDRDGDLEIVIGTGNPLLTNDRIPGAGSVYAWHHTGQLVSGWPISPKNASGDDTAIFSSPTIADVDADGQLEVLFSMIWDVQVYNANGTLQERLPTMWTISASPAIGDANNNGRIDVWIAGGNAQPTADRSKGYLWRFEQNSTGLGVQPWPQFHRDARNSGTYTSLLLPNSREVRIQHRVGTSSTAGGNLMLRNTGSAPISWSATPSNTRVQVSPTTGTVGANGEATLSISVNTQGLAAGIHNLGSITLVGRIGGTEVARVTVPVYLHLGRLLHLPVLRR